MKRFMVIIILVLLTSIVLIGCAPNNRNIDDAPANQETLDIPNLTPELLPELDPNSQNQGVQDDGANIQRPGVMDNTDNQGVQNDNLVGGQ